LIGAVGAVDPFAPIFRSDETGGTRSLNDLWHQLQEATDPFEGVEKAQPPTFRTACFPYPGTVTIASADGPCLLGDVIVTVALWIEAEQVLLDAAKSPFENVDSLDAPFVIHTMD